VKGGPFECSFCHSDFANRFFDAGINPQAESSHPVDVVNDEDNADSILLSDDDPAIDGTASSEIACMDCHLEEYNGTGYRDVAPAGLQIKDDLDGYPNHRLPLNAGFYAYQAYDAVGDVGKDAERYPNDASNKSHLVRPYGYSVAIDVIQSVPYAVSDPMRYVDWGGNLLDDSLNKKMLCFVCHDGSASTTITETGKTSKYDIAKEYFSPADLWDGTNGTAGHVMRIPGDTLGDISAGDKMPCFNCHDSHASNDTLNNNRNAKLIRMTSNPYNTSKFGTEISPSQYKVTDITIDVNGKIDERKICAMCHDTGLSASVASTGGVVEGITPIDPFNGSPVHACNGVTDLNLATSVSCLQNSSISPAGCHANAHNPSVPRDDGPCFRCHGSGCGDITQVKDSATNGHYNGFGRGGDFGASTTKNNTAITGIISAHNIDFDATNHGGDTSGGTVRGSCTVCHTIKTRANGYNYHADGDPRNDFRDVDPDGSDADEIQGIAPVEISPTEGYRYEPEWFLCVDCHDDQLQASAGETPYFNIIGNSVPAPLNLDELRDIIVPFEYPYGSGDYETQNHHTQTGDLVNDKLVAPGYGADNNATPVKRFNWQPYKAHYYQTDGVVASQVWVDEIDPLLTNPMLSTYFPASPTFLNQPVLRIINCLDCHWGHGSRNASLYRSPDLQFASNHTTGIDNANGRDICLDCHDDDTINTIDFPRSLKITHDTQYTKGPQVWIPATEPTRRMWKPPILDRYNHPINATNDLGESGNPHDLSGLDTVGEGISCSNPKTGDPASFRCHNTHSPSCETCHGYPPAGP
ncbi:cytochrome c3 family protein, partial [Thermodesulfobacteriota bacterium]